ncbi:MAG: hypothetical protein M9894_03220 [Planctomycetes bacterium]|nr:hypothetical protein [Planctomycetota bacterium]
MLLELQALLILSVPITTLAEARDVLARGEPLTEVPPDVAREAIAAITPDLVPEEFAELVAIGRLGEDPDELWRALVPIVVARSESSREAVVALAGLATRQLRPGEPPPPVLPAEALEVGQALAREDEEDRVAEAAAILVLPRSTPDDAAWLLEAWVAQGAARRVTALLGALHRVSDPAAIVRHLLAADLGADFARPLADALKRLARDPATADELMEAVSSGAVGPRAAHLRALGGVSLADEERWQRASELVHAFIYAVEDDAAAVPADETAAAVEAGADLLLPRLLPLLPHLALHGRSTAVRVAALEATGRVGYRDAPTIDLLIGLLEDPDGEVARAAYGALLKRSRYRAEHRKEHWVLWRAGVTLPSEPPQSDEERMAEQRRLRAAALVEPPRTNKR